MNTSLVVQPEILRGRSFIRTSEESRLHFQSDYLNAICLAHPESILAPQTVPNGTRLYFVPLEKMDTGHYHCAIFANRKDAQMAVDTGRFLMEEVPTPNPWKVQECNLQKTDRGFVVDSAGFGEKFPRPMPVVGIKGVDCLQDPKTVTSAKVTVVFLPVRDGVQAVILSQEFPQKDSLEELHQIFRGKKPYALPRAIITPEEGVAYRCKVKRYAKNNRHTFFANPKDGWFSFPLILSGELVAHEGVLDPAEVEEEKVVIAMPFIRDEETGNCLGVIFDESLPEVARGKIITTIIRQRIHNRGGETLGDVCDFSQTSKKVAA